MPSTIRRADSVDLASLAAIELAARARFAEEDIPELLRAEIMSERVLHTCQSAGLIWVAEESEHAVVGFLVAKVMEEGLHVLQMSVRPAQGNQGIGTQLLVAVNQEAKRKEMTFVTLTTFSHIPWNAPFYSRRGFDLLAPQQLTPGLRRCLAQERAAGLANRVAMRKHAA